MDERIISSETSDEELISSFQAGNERAFVTIVSRFKNPLMNFVFRYIGDRDDAEDIVQETFIRLYKNKQAYRPIAKFSTWLYTISGNLARSYLRRKKIGRMISIFQRQSGREDAEYEIPDNRYRADRELEESNRTQIVQDALLSLDQHQREIIILSDIQDLSYEEICQITGLKMGTVKSRLNRARSHLKKLLQDVADDL
ncbi:MAG: RNA polymerase sigma factor [Bacteroidota bacterium]